MPLSVADWIGRAYYGIPEKIFSLLRPVKAPLLTFLIAWFAIPTILSGVAVTWAVLSRSPDPMYLLLLSMYELIVAMHPNPQPAMPNALQEFTSRLTPLQHDLVEGLGWIFLATALLMVISFIWLSFRITRYHEHAQRAARKKRR